MYVDGKVCEEVMMVRFGIIGYGQRVAGLVRNNFKAVDPDLKIVGIVDPDEKGVRERLDERDREAVTFYGSLDAMMRRAKPDVLVIGTRCNLHTPYAIQAAKYDVPLFLEKPVAVNMRQASALEKAFRKAACKTIVSFPLRVSPLCVLAREYIDNGAVGAPQHVHAINYVPYGICYWTEGYRDYDVTQGLFLQKATHDFDYLMFLMGTPIVRVAAMANWGRVFGGDKPAGLTCGKCDEALACPESPRNRQYRRASDNDPNRDCPFSVDCGSPETGINEDCSSALMEFASGAHGAYSQVFYIRRDAHGRGATVSGYEGTVSFDWYTNELKRVRHHAPFSDTIKADGSLSHFGGDTALTDNLFDVLEGHAESRTPIELGIQSVYACLAAKESAHKGRFVQVRQVEM